MRNTRKKRSKAKDRLIKKKRKTVLFSLISPSLKQDSRDAFLLLVRHRGISKRQAFDEAIELWISTSPGEEMLRLPPFSNMSTEVISQFRERCDLLGIPVQRGLEDAIITYLRNLAFTDTAEYRKKVRAAVRKENKENDKED